MEFRGIKYSPQTGMFYRVKTKGIPNVKVGVWGWLRPDGYKRGYHSGKNHLLHRVAFNIMMKRDLRDDEYIDHINGNRSDNRWCNLRIVNRATNYQNRKYNREGKMVGCYYEKQCRKYKAVVQRNKKKINIGRFNTEIEAHTAYINYLEENGMEFLAEADKRIK